MSAPTAAANASPTLGRGLRPEDGNYDLTSFRQVCHRLYYDKDPTSARQVDHILSRLPVQDRTMYARAMADVRSAYHRDEEIRRRAQVEHLLAEVEPASIVVKGALNGVSAQHSVPSVAAMRSPQARRFRAERFKRFLSANCHEANIMPGPHPFLRGLYATLWLQTRTDTNRCVEWTVDVAVLTEAGSGQSWTRDAVELLKGVLGMSERIQGPQVASTYADSTYTSRLSSALSDLSTSRAAPHPIEISIVEQGGGGPPPPVPPHRGSTLRTRAPSDPFLDNKALLPLVAPDEEKETGFGSSVAPLLPSSSQTVTVSSPLDPLGGDSDLASPTASTPFLPNPTSAFAASAASDDEEHAPDAGSCPTAPQRPPPPPPPTRSLPNPAVPHPQFRTFTVPPYLTNPELYALLRLFPSFIATPVRRAVSSSNVTRTTIDEWEEKLSAVVHGEVALASGEGAEGEGGMTTARRSEGWKGTLWERFLIWLQRLFSLM
ncbi:hypothetical protein C6P46_000241 [Rhodotorula mucilaginosa]|uniref:Uncharacterized protein n=2 Tax=root TaxID=1 RepID=A0A9P6W7P6_RHOMI|nr:hypothetical protein C6P46_000241 [Rhodotorula mucilaginosa]